MAERYRSGQTLNEIGEVYGITRERVRQILSRDFDFTWKDGGGAIAAAKKRAKTNLRRSQECFEKWGCSLGQRRDMLNYCRALRSAGVTNNKTPLGAFGQQKNNARIRGVEWNFKFWDWWTLWQESGHWDERGRGQGYVMARIEDTGPYELGNVVITLARVNSSNTKNKKSDLPVGVVELPSGRFGARRMISGKLHALGAFDTPEEAYRAYIEASNVVPLHNPVRNVA